MMSMQVKHDSTHSPFCLPEKSCLLCKHTIILVAVRTYCSYIEPETCKNMMFLTKNICFSADKLPVTSTIDRQIRCRGTPVLKDVIIYVLQILQTFEPFSNKNKACWLEYRHVQCFHRLFSGIFRQHAISGSTENVCGGGNVSS